MYALSLKQMKEIKYIHSDIERNLSSPKEIVPVLIHTFQPKSVVDMGCAHGAFLHVFAENGIQDILGIDGDWVNKEQLMIKPSQFETHDLENKISLNRKFDLVVCLEVAEHLTESASDILVSNLIALGDIIIFSAAIKNQTGQNHINEQPFSYWMKKFNQKGFLFYDAFRQQFWNNSTIAWWYKQNMFLVAHENLDMHQYIPGIQPLKEVLEYVHPELMNTHYQNLEAYKIQNRKIRNGELSLSFYMQLLKKKIYRKFFKK